MDKTQLKQYFEEQTEIIDTTDLQLKFLISFAEALDFYVESTGHNRRSPLKWIGLDSYKPLKFYTFDSRRRIAIVSWKTIQMWYNHPKAFEIVSGKIIRIAQFGKTKALKKFCHYDYFWDEAHKNKPFEKICLQYHKKTKSFKAQKNLLKFNQGEGNE